MEFYATRNLFIKYAGRGGAEFRRGNKFGRARIFTARVICSEILILQRCKFEAL